MTPAPIPKDEADRLAELHSLKILDTSPEERFDRITRLLAMIMKVPIAYISLVDTDRQWFKSSKGLEVLETPRSISFCGYALLSDGPLIIPDTLEDERFHDNPLVVNPPNIRFYAGRALTGPGGHKLGTLCIADRKPRQLQPDEIEAWKVLAQLVERELGLVEVARLQRDLIANQEHMVRELAQASAYVRSLLPEPLDGAVRTRWMFEPSSQLGGDFFGYDWIDPDHFAVYLLDVSGHGVGAALLSVSVANVLRSRSLAGTDFRDPSAVLAALNDTFPMERHDGKYFTIWYGVFNRESRSLAYASAGHPPAVLTGCSQQCGELETPNFGVGMFSDVVFKSAALKLEPQSRIHVFSDGAYEVRKPSGGMMKLQELTSYLRSNPGHDSPEDILRYVRQVGGEQPLADDFSLVEVFFD